MKRAFIIVIIVLLAVALAGCTSSSSHITVIEQGFAYNIVYDNETKVMYLQGGSGRFEVMLNADGTPRIWEG